MQTKPMSPLRSLRQTCVDSTRFIRCHENRPPEMRGPIWDPRAPSSWHRTPTDRELCYRCPYDGWNHKAIASSHTKPRRETPTVRRMQKIRRASLLESRGATRNPNQDIANFQQMNQAVSLRQLIAQLLSQRSACSRGHPPQQSDAL